MPAVRIKSMLAPLLRREFLRYLAVGALNTGFSYSIYALLLWLGLAYFVANLIALVCGIVFSFQMQGRYVFDNTSRRLFPKYMVLWVLIYFCNIALIKLLLVCGFNAYVAGALALPPIVLLSYVLQKYLIFNVNRRPDQIS
jgi:putative flippase GtrA